MEIIFYSLSNLFFIYYWIFRTYPIIKFLATFLLFISYLHKKKSFRNNKIIIQLLVYSLGDYLLECPNGLNNSLILFGLGKITKLNIKKKILGLFLIFINQNLQILNYILIHILVLFHIIKNNRKNKLFLTSHFLFVLSDILIGLELLGYGIKNYEYISYPLYWSSNLLLYNTHMN